MKRIVAILTVVLFTITAMAVFAEQATEPKPAEKKAVTKYMTVKGEVVAVDPAQNSITIKGKKGDVALTTTDKTKVMIGKEKKSLQDVKIGDSATARYKVEGEKKIATQIIVTPKKAEAPKAPEAPAKK